MKLEIRFNKDMYKKVEDTESFFKLEDVSKICLGIINDGCKGREIVNYKYKEIATIVFTEDE